MADYLPLFNDGDPFTLTAAEKAAGGQLAVISGDRSVSVAEADADAIGVFGFNVEPGDLVTIYPGGVQRPIAAASIDAGDRVAAAADGKVSPGGTNFIGTALAASAAGEPATIKFDR